MKRIELFASGAVFAAGLAVMACLGTACLGLGAPARAADEPLQCKRAEVNPVTGYTFCVDPLGAPVAPPPKADPCKTGPDAPDPAEDADFTWRPTCTDEGEGA